MKLCAKRLSARHRRDQKNLRVIRNSGLIEVGSRDIGVINAHDRIGMRIIDFLEQIGDGHPCVPVDVFVRDPDHDVTP
jgi:hypothetical protein